MKKTILTLLILASSIVTPSYARYYVEYDEPEYVEYVDYDEPEVEYYYDDYEPEIIVERPVRYIRKPFVQETVVVTRPTHVIRHCHYECANPAAAFFSGLAGFGIGAAVGAAIAG